VEKSLTLIKSSLIKQLTKWDEFVVYGQQARLLKDAGQWILGDLAQAVEKKYGEDSIGKYAHAIGVNKKSLIEYRRVARAFPRKSNRLAFLSWTHHQRALKAEHPKKVLLLAHDNEWSIRQMDRYMIEKKSVDCPHKKWETFRKCKKCGLIDKQA